MAYFTNVSGTSSQTFQIQKAGLKLKNNSGLEVYAANGTTLVGITGLGLVSGNASQAGSMKMFGDTNYMVMQYASGQTADTTYTFPKPDNGKYLTTNGSGVLSWVDLPAAVTDMVRVASKAFTWESSSPVSLKSLPVGAIVTKVQIIVDTLFNAAATASVGIAGTVEKYLAAADCDLTIAGIYEAQYTNAAISGSPEATILTLVPGSASVGAGRVLVYYVIPETL